MGSADPVLTRSLSGMIFLILMLLGNRMKHFRASIKGSKLSRTLSNVLISSKSKNTIPDDIWLLIFLIPLPKLESILRNFRILLAVCICVLFGLGGRCVLLVVVRGLAAHEDRESQTNFAISFIFF